MTFRTFRESQPTNGYYIVTLEPTGRRPDGTWGELPRIAVALEWEDSNAKWYRPEGVFGREECGYTDIVNMGDVDTRVVDVRSLRAGRGGLDE